MFTFEVVIIILLLGLNAFLAASEISIVSARKPRMQALVDSGDRRAVHVLDLIENPSGFLATVQVGITVAGFFASAVGAVSLAQSFESLVEEVPISIIADNARGVTLVITTVMLSFVSIVFGELVPKTIAVGQAESVALRVVGPIRVIGTLARPIVYFLTATTNLILRLLGMDARARLPSVTREEILALLEAAEDEGVVEADDADLIEEAFEFGEKQVRSIMVPRVDVVAVEADASLQEASHRFIESGFSRMPVYRETLDQIVGILHVKDVFRLLIEGDSERPTARQVARPAYFVPETKPIDQLLAELRIRRTHLAIVIDEFGGVAGIVSLEDVIEELVGEISDEFDPNYEPFRDVQPGVLEVDGRVTLSDLLDRMDLDPDLFNQFHVESVGGMITYLLGRIPSERDVVEVERLQFVVLEMIDNRVQRVLVRHIQDADPDPDIM